MDYSKIKALGDKVFVRIEKQSIEDLYSKEITRVDGSKGRLFINVQAGDNDDRKATLFVRTGVVINKGPRANKVEVGDVVILSYEAYNDESKFLGTENEDKIIWVHANTTYHKGNLVAHADRRIRKEQKVWDNGEVDQLSQIIGIVRNDEVIANDPYVFLHHEQHEIQKETKSKIIYNERPQVIERTVLSVPDESTRKFGITKGSQVVLKELDTFEVKLGDRKITCINDSDVMYVNHDVQLKAV